MTGPGESSRFSLLHKGTAAIIALMLVSACGKSKDSEPSEAAAAALSKATTEQGATPKADPDRVSVIYFHGNKRCPTCLGIQAAVEETMGEKFSQATDAGMLVFDVRNFEAEENAALAEKYNVAFSTLIVATQAGDTVLSWKNADKLWDYAHEPAALKAYVTEQVSAALKPLGVE